MSDITKLTLSELVKNIKDKILFLFFFAPETFWNIKNNNGKENNKTKILSQGERAKLDNDPAKKASKLNSKYFIFFSRK